MFTFQAGMMVGVLHPVTMKIFAIYISGLGFYALSNSIVQLPTAQNIRGLISII